MIDWLFAPQCAACATPTTEPFCATCSTALVENVDPTPGVIAPWHFGGPLATAIRRLKFTGKTHLARDLAPLWAPVLAAMVQAHDAIVVPIPLHWRRRFGRGFDQTWLLARHACSLAGLAPPISALRRTRATPAQSTLAKPARAGNLIGAFAVRRAIANRAVILVDDVVTTGATFAAATTPLREAGATIVLGLALART